MLTIKTKPDCTLGFVECPPNTENRWVENLRIKGSTYIEGPERGKTTELEGKLILGKLSEITEEQAKELVDEYRGIYKLYPCLGINLKNHFHFIDCGDFEGTYKATESFHSAALSVGIEEKDFENYLVIKL